MSCKQAFNSKINKRVKFFEKEHVYKLYNEEDIFEKNLISGTTFLGKFFPKFEKDQIALRIAKRDNKSVKQVLEKWDLTGKLASDFGTKCHLYGEMYVLNKPLPICENEKEEAYFLSMKKFLDDKLNSGWDLIEPEKIVFDNYIGGTVDLLLVNHTKKQYGVWDWKTNKKIDTHSFYGDEYGFAPIDFLENCNYNKYLIQLALYTYLLQKGNFLDNESYSIKNTILHITKEGVIPYRPSMDLIPYVKQMEQKLFKIRIR